VYLLLDANVTAGYYLPRSLASRKAGSRIEVLLDSIRSGDSKHFLYIPNFCIAEVFSVFMKYAFGRWNTHVQKTGKIDRRVYERLVLQFQEDIHNGRFLYQYELSRYHILGINLVAPIDHYFQFTRGKKRRHVPMGTFDHLLVAMGIHLAHIHGQANVAIVSADNRLTNILSKCKSGLKAATIEKLKLKIAEEVTGRPFSAALFPQHVNLASDSNKDLRDVFGTWPPPIGKRAKVYRWPR